METALERIPAVGTALVEVLQEGKKIIRRGIYHSTMFEEMGFQYVGPVDGHDVTELTRIFTNLQEQYSPVFLHIVTQKGKGLKPAEENPGEFHSVSAFDLDHLTNPEMSPKDSFSNRFGNKLAVFQENAVGDGGVAVHRNRAVHRHPMGVQVGAVKVIAFLGGRLQNQAVVFKLPTIAGITHPVAIPILCLGRVTVLVNHQPGQWADGYG